jgi:ribonuclease HI
VWNKKVYLLCFGDFLPSWGGRCGGVVLDPEGNQEVIFEWDISGATNNQVEVLAIYQGLNILDPRYE